MTESSPWAREVTPPAPKPPEEWAEFPKEPGDVAKVGTMTVATANALAEMTGGHAMMMVSVLGNALCFVLSQCGVNREAFRRIMDNMRDEAEKRFPE